MAADAVARRYAEAFLTLAGEKQKVDAYAKELRSAVEVLSSTEVLDALSNPRLAMSDRVRLALDLVDGLGQPARNLVRLLVEHGRIRILPAVSEEYQRLTDVAGGVVRAEVTSAFGLSSEQRAEVTDTLRTRLRGNVEVTFREDPGIVGGLIVRAGERVIDTSIRTQLQQLQASLR